MIENYLYGRLSGFAGLSALVSTRISPMKAIQASEFPCVTFKRIAGGLDYTHDGADETTASMWQLDSWASDAPAARAVAKQVVDALAADEPPTFYAFVDDIRHDYEPDTKAFRVSIDVRIIYREPS